MGILSCNRYGCDNPMCDRFSPVHGHICDECFDELVRGGPTAVSEFMDTPKRDAGPLFDFYDHYNKIFPTSQERYREYKEDRDG